MIPKPLSHKKFNNIVNTIVTQIFTNATLYIPWTVSIPTWVKENTKYIKAGGHIFFKTIYIMLRKNLF